YLPEFGINYENITELGIEDEIRKSYVKEKLWRYYINSLQNKKGAVQKAIEKITSEPTVLMCLEENPTDCHRLRLAQELQKLTGLPIIDYNKGYNKWKVLS
ncbi:MAG: DUF488 domain-containing protein, partial [Actinobacteria bacterium]|nr:DUF488 domain-containing protein [Actinomycetota bacterium]